LPEIQAPTLVIVGELDQPDALSSADALAAGITGARKVVIPSAAHLPSMERPAEFNRIVLEFIRGL
jgi:pimeloyl-ACP methyl ester carboxylesterase